MKLYELAGQYAGLKERAETGEDLTDSLAMLEGEIETKAAQLVYIARELELNAEGYDAEIKRLSERKRALVANRERLREYIRANMLACGIEKIKAPTFTITLSDGPERVEVEDETLVPDTYVRTKREVNKAAVLDAYRETGEILPGCRIERGTRLVIR